MYTRTSATYIRICSFNHFRYTVGPDQAPHEFSGAVAQTEVTPKGVAGMYIHRYCSGVAYSEVGLRF